MIIEFKKNVKNNVRLTKLATNLHPSKSILLLDKFNLRMVNIVKRKATLMRFNLITSFILKQQ
jgi:hypothetical protein